MIFPRWSTRKAVSLLRMTRRLTISCGPRRRSESCRGQCMRWSLVRTLHMSCSGYAKLCPAVLLNKELNPKCNECGSMDVDQMFKKVFGCFVCNTCKNEKPEKYSLLTKTECKEVNRITSFCSMSCSLSPSGLFIDRRYVFGSSTRLAKANTISAELRDQELMPHMLKANPHKSTFANMMLFLRYQVESFAWKKWGSPEALDAEYERRVVEKKKKRKKKYEEGLKELRRRTRETVWQRRKDQEHRHVFGPSVKDPNGMTKQVCHECGFTVEIEEF